MRRVQPGGCDAGSRRKWVVLFQDRLAGQSGRSPFCELPACLPSALLLGPLKKKACLSFVLLQAKSQRSESSLLISQSSAQTLKLP